MAVFGLVATLAEDANAQRVARSRFERDSRITLGAQYGARLPFVFKAAPQESGADREAEPLRELCAWPEILQLELAFAQLDPAGSALESAGRPAAPTRGGGRCSAALGA